MIKEMGFEFSVVLEENENSSVEFCIHPSLKDELICKSFYYHSDLNSKDSVTQSKIESLELEARLGSKLHSPIYPKVRDLKHLSGPQRKNISLQQSKAICLVRDFVGGISFEQLGLATKEFFQRIENDPLNSNILISLQEFWLNNSLALAEGLYELQCLGYAHGDLSLSNLRLDSTGKVKLMDLGLASEFGNCKGGTPEFFSPGHLVGDLNSRSDLFAVGLHLCYWVCGSQPLLGMPLKEVSNFLSDLENTPHKIDEWLRDNLNTSLQDVALDWHRLIRACLVPEKEGGFEDLDELTENLEIFKKNLSNIRMDKGEFYEGHLLEETEFKKQFESAKKLKDMHDLKYFKDISLIWEPNQLVPFFMWGQNHSELKDEWAEAWQNIQSINKHKANHWISSWQSQLKVVGVVVLLLTLFSIGYFSILSSKPSSIQLDKFENSKSFKLKMVGFNDSLKYSENSDVKRFNKNNRVLFMLTPELKESLVKESEMQGDRFWSMNGKQLLDAGIWMNTLKLRSGFYILKVWNNKGVSKCWKSNFLESSTPTQNNYELTVKKIKWVEKPCINEKWEK